MNIRTFTLIFALIASTTLLGDSVEILWQWKIDSNGIQVSQAPDGTIIVAGSNRLSAYEPDDGGLIWQKDMGEEVANAAPVIGPDGVFYQMLIHDTDHTSRLVAFSVETGNQVWEYFPGTRNLSHLLLSDSRLYYVDRSVGKIKALEASSGNLAWTYIASEDIEDKITMVRGVIYTYERNDGSWGMIGIDSDNGSKVFTLLKPFHDNHYWVGRRVIGGTGGKIHAQTNGGIAYQIDPSTGDWIVTYSGLNTAYRLIDANGITYSEDDDYLIAIKESTGSHIWRFEVAPNAATETLAATSDGTLYCSVTIRDPVQDTHYLYAIDSTNLTQKFSSGNSRNYANIKWRLPTNVRSLVIAKDGNIIVGANDGTLYAIKGSAPVGEAPWPMVKGNAQNTYSTKTVEPHHKQQSGDELTPILPGWSWMELYPWIYNEQTDTWFYMSPVAIGDTAVNYLYNYTTQEWNPLETE